MGLNKKRKLESPSPLTEHDYDIYNEPDQVPKLEAPRNLTKFKFSFKKFFNFGTDLKELDKVVKNADLGVDAASKMIKEAPYKKLENGLLGVEGKTLNQVEDVMKSGNLGKLKEITGSKININSKEIAEFKSVSADLPQSKLDDLDVGTLKNKTRHPELDIKDVEKAPTKVKNVVNKINKKGISVFGTGVKVSLVIGAVYIGKNWLEKATAARKGCFLLATIDNKTTSCRYSAASCSGGTNERNCTSSYKSSDILKSRNVAIFSMYALTNTQLKEKYIAELAKQGVTANLETDLGEHLKSHLMQMTTAMDIIIAALTDSEKTIFDTAMLCKLTHKDVEGGVVPGCRLCDTSGDVTGTSYIDSTNIADNMTYACNANPSILDTITDTIISTGKNILDWGVDIAQYAKYGIIIAVVIVLIIIILKIVGIIFKKKEVQPNVPPINYA